MEAWSETGKPRLGKLQGFETEGMFHFFGVRDTSWEDLRPIGPVANLKQVHGTGVVLVEQELTQVVSTLGEGDALVTKRSGVVLTISTADCVPLLFFDPQRRVIGAAHAGWRGTVKGIATRVVEVLAEQFGSVPAQLRVAIGPCIGPCCYEVGKEVLDQLSHTLPDGIVTRHSADRGTLDLAALNMYQLRSAGLLPSAIRIGSLCTACHPERFFSYRRERPHSGNMISGIRLETV